MAGDRAASWACHPPLDWTLNPLVAGFFAVREDLPGDAKITAVSFKWAVSHENPGNPFKFKDVASFRPDRVASRITQQHGLFSIHPDPKVPLDPRSKDLLDFQEIIIPAEYRKTLRTQLSFYGFNEHNLFPGLDGLSSFVNWTLESREYWTAGAAKPTMQGEIPFG